MCDSPHRWPSKCCILISQTSRSTDLSKRPRPLPVWSIPTLSASSTLTSPMASPSLSPRQKICSRKSGECRKSKNSKKREKRRGNIHDRPQKKIQTEEEDHESVRNSIGTLAQTSQGTLSRLTQLSTRNAGLLCPRHCPSRLSSHATSSRNHDRIFGQ